MLNVDQFNKDGYLLWWRNIVHVTLSLSHVTLAAVIFYM